MIRLSREQVRRVDQICIEEYGLPGIVLMENAARSAADAIDARYGSIHEHVIGIVCGTGNNGGDGYALARHLANRGARVRLVENGEPKTADATVMRAAVIRMGLEFVDIDRMAQDHGDVHIWVDAIFGTGLSRPPTAVERRMIEMISETPYGVVALDLPSGLDCDTGKPLGEACIRATCTITFVAEKRGFANPRSREFTGDVVVGDIGCPREIIERVTRE